MLSIDSVALAQDVHDTSAPQPTTSSAASCRLMERLLRRVDPGDGWFAKSAPKATPADPAPRPLRYLPI